MGKIIMCLVKGISLAFTVFGIICVALLGRYFLTEGNVIIGLFIMVLSAGLGVSLLLWCLEV